LPVFERDGDLYAVHVQPGVAWTESAWLQLPHDAAAPVLVASSLRFLAAGLLGPPHWFANRLDEVWPAGQALAAAIPGAPPLDRVTYLKKVLRPERIAVIDPEDVASQLFVATRAAESDEEAGAAVLSILRAAPDHPFALAAEAQRRAQFGEDAAEPAMRVLRTEVAWGPCHPMRWFVDQADSGPELLERVRPLAAARIDDDSPFAPMRTVAYTSGKASEGLALVAKELAADSQDALALVQLRNGAAVAGERGRINRRWCERLAEQSERVEPGGLSAALARHAASVIEQGP